MKKQTKYPKWLLIFFALSATSWFMSFLGAMIKLIIAISIWELPTVTDWWGLWFGLSNLGIAISIWIAIKIDG